MALSSGFIQLWQDRSFRQRVQVLVIGASLMTLSLSWSAISSIHGLMIVECSWGMLLGKRSCQALNRRPGAKPRVGWLPIKITTRCLTIQIGDLKRKKRKSRMERVRKVSRENTSWHWI
ncbi:hypothetical protein B0H10DRAFT_535102 [Mycena sp. CBHHK59/15]|nr:hypothetical protein B0H10DRAFT_535102 [Mycena sp. CBHHK59/15]